LRTGLDLIFIAQTEFNFSGCDFCEHQKRLAQGGFIENLHIAGKTKSQENRSCQF